MQYVSELLEAQRRKVNGDNNNKVFSDLLYNVQVFGAKGDGVKDDTEAILDALAEANENGGIVYFPQGTYRFYSTLEITKNGVSIRGAGKDQTRLVPVGCDGIKMSSYYSSVEDLSLLGISTTKTGVIINASYNRVQGVFFGGYTANTDYWAKCIYGTNVWNSQITDNDFIGGFGHVGYFGYGVYMDYCVNNQISLNHFEDLQYAVYASNVASTGGTYCEGIIITDNLIISIQYGVHLNAGVWFDVSHNIIDQVTNLGVYIDVSRSVTVSDNWISHYGTDLTTFLGVHVKGGYDIGINDNSILTSYTDVTCGLKVETNYNTLTGNRLNNFKTGIQVLGDYNSITGNVVLNATVYDIDLQGDHNQVQGNTMQSMGLNIASGKVSNETQYDTYACASSVVTNGEASKTIDVAIPAGRFSAKPNVGIVTSSDYFNQYKIVASYLYDDPANTKTNARFNIAAPSGNLPSSSYTLRLSVFLAK